MSGINAVNHFVEQYSSNLAHLLQYQGTKFRGSVTESTYNSNGGVVVDQYGAVEMSEVVSRFAPMSRTDVPTDRIWIYPRDFHVPGLMVDTFDKLRMIHDPQSPTMQAALKACQRKIDDLITDAFFGTVKSGVSGGTSDTFDTTNHRVDAAIGAAADTGLNVDKIIAARKILQNNEVDLDMEEVYLAISPEQEEDLLRQQQVISSDYATTFGITRNSNGGIASIMGCKVITSTKTPSNSSYRLCPMWVKSGMHLGVWADVKSRIDTRPDIEGVPWQIYPTLTMNATRVEAGRVIQIECTE